MQEAVDQPRETGIENLKREVAGKMRIKSEETAEYTKLSDRHQRPGKNGMARGCLVLMHREVAQRDDLSTPLCNGKNLH